MKETNEIIYSRDIAVLQTRVICQTRIQKIRRDKFCVSECNHESKAAADENILTQAGLIRSFLASPKMQNVPHNK